MKGIKTILRKHFSVFFISIIVAIIFLTRKFKRAMSTNELKNLSEIFTLESRHSVRGNYECLTFVVLEKASKSGIVQEDMEFCRSIAKKAVFDTESTVCPFHRCKLTISKTARERSRDISLNTLESSVCKKEIEWASVEITPELNAGNTNALIVAGTLQLQGSTSALLFCKFDKTLGYAFQSTNRQIDTCIVPSWSQKDYLKVTSEFEVLLLRRATALRSTIRELPGLKSFRLLNDYFKEGPKFEPFVYYRGTVKVHHSMRKPDKVRFNLIDSIKKLITSIDEKMIESITGYKFQELLSGIQNLDISYIYLFLSDAQFIPHELNRKGLHILRAILAERIFDQKCVKLYGSCKIHASACEDFLRDGIIITKFQSTDEMQKWILSKQRDSKILRPKLLYENGDPFLGQFVRCMFDQSEYPQQYIRNGKRMIFKVQKVVHKRFDMQTHPLGNDLSRFGIDLGSSWGRFGLNENRFGSIWVDLGLSWIDVESFDSI